MEVCDEFSICCDFPPRMLQVMQVGSTHPQSNNLQSLPDAALADTERDEQTSALRETVPRASLPLQRGAFVQLGAGAAGWTVL